MSNRVFSFHYTLTDSSGKKLDSSEEGHPLTILEGVGQIIPGLEAVLLNMKTGDKKRVTVPADHAYGPKDAAKTIEMPLEKMPTRTINVGDHFRSGPEPHAPVLTATKVTETHVTLDANHPLAGMDLTFDLDVTEVREATAEEIAHGHAHGPDGHGH